MARLTEDLGGLHREMLDLQSRLDAVEYPAEWSARLCEMCRPSAAAAKTRAAVRDPYTARAA